MHQLQALTKGSLSEISFGRGNAIRAVPCSQLPLSLIPLRCRNLESGNDADTLDREFLTRAQRTRRDNRHPNLIPAVLGSSFFGLETRLRERERGTLLYRIPTAASVHEMKLRIKTRSGKSLFKIANRKIIHFKRDVNKRLKFS